MMGGVLPRHAGNRGRNKGAVMPMMRWVLWMLGALVRDGGAVMPMMRGCWGLL